MKSANVSPLKVLPYMVIHGVQNMNSTLHMYKYTDHWAGIFYVFN